MEELFNSINFGVEIETCFHILDGKEQTLDAFVDCMNSKSQNKEQIYQWEYDKYDITWEDISASPSLTIDAIEYYKNELDYDNLSSNPNITIKFIEENIDKDWDWSKLSSNPVVNWNFIKKHPEKEWNKKNLNKNTSIPWDHFKTIENIGLTSVASNPIVTQEIILSYPTTFWDSGYLELNPNVTMEFIKQHPEFNWGTFYLSENPNITWEYIKNNYPGDWRWDNILKQPGIKWRDIQEIKTFLEKKVSKNWWDVVNKFISLNPNVNIKIVKDNPTFPWNWMFLAENKSILWNDIVNNPDLFLDLDSYDNLFYMRSDIPIKILLSFILTDYKKWRIMLDQSIDCNKKQRYCILNGNKQKGKCRLKFSPIEIITPVLTGRLGLKILYQVWQGWILTNNIVYAANYSQGLHINLSSNMVSVEKFTDCFLKWWLPFEQAILSLLPGKRIKQIANYAIPLSTYQGDIDELRDEKFVSVGRKSNRIEIRIRHGSIDIREIYLWTVFCMLFACFAIKNCDNVPPVVNYNNMKQKEQSLRLLLDLIPDGSIQQFLIEEYSLNRRLNWPELIYTPNSQTTIISPWNILTKLEQEEIHKLRYTTC
jgi:hypothetical protein